MKPHKPLRQQENINIKLRIPCNKDKVPKAFGKQMDVLPGSTKISGLVKQEPKYCNSFF